MVASFSASFCCRPQQVSGCSGSVGSCRGCCTVTASTGLAATSEKSSSKLWPAGRPHPAALAAAPLLPHQPPTLIARTASLYFLALASLSANDALSCATCACSSPSWPGWYGAAWLCRAGDVHSGWLGERGRGAVGGSHTGSKLVPWPHAACRGKGSRQAHAQVHAQGACATP